MGAGQSVCRGCRSLGTKRAKSRAELTGGATISPGDAISYPDGAAFVLNQG